MKMITFAWTWPALVAGQKTVTRRPWHPNTARRFAAGDVVWAFNKSPRFDGQAIATIRLTTDPEFGTTGQLTADDYHAEGFAYMHAHPELRLPSPFTNFSPAIFDLWRAADESVHVIRFELVEVHALAATPALVASV